jgi:hypothetical protein
MDLFCVRHPFCKCNEVNQPINFASATSEVNQLSMHRDRAVRLMINDRKVS